MLSITLLLYVVSSKSYSISYFSRINNLILSNVLNLSVRLANSLSSNGVLNNTVKVIYDSMTLQAFIVQGNTIKPTTLYSGELGNQCANVPQYISQSVLDQQNLRHDGSEVSLLHVLPVISIMVSN